MTVGRRDDLIGHHSPGTFAQLRPKLSEIIPSEFDIANETSKYF